MGGISHPFFLTLLHSLWQTSMIAILVFLFKKHHHIHPASIRKIAVYSLYLQFALSILTFGLLFHEPNDDFVYNVLRFPLPYFPLVEQIAIFAYLGIVTFLIIKTIISWNNFHQMVTTGRIQAPFHFRIFAKDKAKQIGIKRKVSLFLSEKITVPVTFGVIKPIILLPVAFLNQLTIKETESIILHELQHIRVKDYLINWVCIISEIVYFFNPAITYILKEIRSSRERSCDAVVLDHQYSPHIYASALLKAANHYFSNQHFALGATGNKTEELKLRVEFMRDAYPLVKNRNIWPSLIPVLLFITCCSLLFTSKTPLPSFGAFKVSGKEEMVAEIPVIYKNVPLFSNQENQQLVNHTTRPGRKAKTERTATNKDNLEEAGSSVALPVDPQFNYFPVVNKATPFPKEITVTEEHSDLGTLVTSHYLLSRDSSGYQLTLLWKIEENKIPDSLRSQVGDSSIIYLPTNEMVQ